MVGGWDVWEKREAGEEAINSEERESGGLCRVV